MATGTSGGNLWDRFGSIGVLGLEKGPWASYEGLPVCFCMVSVRLAAAFPNLSPSDMSVGQPGSGVGLTSAHRLLRRMQSRMQYLRPQRSEDKE